MVYQGQDTVWVRPAEDGANVDAGSSVDGVPQHPDWSPDGSRLVFEVDFSAIWTVAADGSDPRRLYDCTAPCYVVQDAAWSPDGREIAFREEQTEDGETTSREVLRAMVVADGHLRTIHSNSTGRVGFYSPRWSDDGDSLVFEEDVFASSRLDETVLRRMRVVTVGADGRDRRVLATWKGPLAGPGSPAPDWFGEQVVFVRDDNLMLLDVVTGRSRPLTTYDGVTEHAIQPTFSPDGTSIAFTYVQGTFDVDDRPEGAVVNLETRVVTKLDLVATHVRLGP